MNISFQFLLYIMIACVAGGIVGARNNVLTAEPLKVSGEAVRRMERRTLKLYYWYLYFLKLFKLYIIGIYLYYLYY